MSQMKVDIQQEIEGPFVVEIESNSPRIKEFVAKYVAAAINNSSFDEAIERIIQEENEGGTEAAASEAVQ